jgi:hypothetical protein
MRQGSTELFHGKPQDVENFGLSTQDWEWEGWEANERREERREETVCPEHLDLFRILHYQQECFKCETKHTDSRQGEGHLVVSPSDSAPGSSRVLEEQGAAAGCAMLH